MSKIKKTFITAGGIVGGIVGGTVGVIGKVIKKDFLEDLGDDIIDSTIHTGEIAGDVVSGSQKIISGKISKNIRKVDSGTSQLKSGGQKIIKNFTENLQTISLHSKEILDGIKNNDNKKIANNAKKLGKIVIINIVTVGAVKTESEKSEKKEDH